jgi:hypothetical protein
MPHTQFTKPRHVVPSNLIAVASVAGSEAEDAAVNFAQGKVWETEAHGRDA